jgi:putative endonuclease
MSLTNRKQQVGKWGEDQAACFLEKKGYRIQERNLRTVYGEIDLVARIEDTTVFVEVKTRTNQDFGLPELAVTHEKRSHLIRAIQAYWLRQPASDCAWRVDVIAIRGRPGGKDIEIEHFENAITE